MTERTYGPYQLRLEDFADCKLSGAKELTSHIRELQSELAEAKLQQLATASQAAELEVENAKLKAERREFAHSCAKASRDAVTCRLIEARGKGENFWDAALTVDMFAIVEQEMNK